MASGLTYETTEPVVATLEVKDELKLLEDVVMGVLGVGAVGVGVGVNRANESYVSIKSSREYSSNMTKPSSVLLILRAQSMQ